MHCASVAIGAENFDQVWETVNIIEAVKSCSHALALTGLEYIASYGDLIHAFGVNEQAGAAHYAEWGYNEHRSSSSFNAAQYLANYADLQAAFGSDLHAVTEHYINFGYNEGRVDQIL